MNDTQMNDGIDRFLDNMQSRSQKCFQIASDATRILSDAGNSLNSILDVGSSFLGRIKDCLDSVKEIVGGGKVRRELQGTQEELAELKNFSVRMIEALNQRNLLTADAVITVKNNLNCIAKDQNDMKDAITSLAKKSAEKFRELEGRVSQVESSVNLSHWVANLEFDEEYKKLKNQNLNSVLFLKTSKGFYLNKQGNYTINEIKSFNRALNLVGLDPKKEMSLGEFFDGIIKDSQEIGEKEFNEIAKVELSDGKILSSDEIAKILSIPSFVAVCSLFDSKRQLELPIKGLQNKLNCSVTEALQDAIKEDIANKNGVDLNTKVSCFDLGIELISCYSAIPQLVKDGTKGVSNIKMNTSKFCGFCGKQIDGAAWCGFCGKKQIR